MATPLFKVEVAFADGPNAASPTYTDISTYVRRDPPLSYSRGNNDEVSQLQAGTMSFTVDNTDGRFTVGSAASTSAWGTVLKIRRPVRLSIWNGTSYVVAWTGTVDDWGTNWMGGKKGLASVSCSDKIGRLGRIELRSLLEGDILADTPTGYYRLNEDSGTTAGSIATADAPILSTAQTGTGGTLTFGTGVAAGLNGQTAITVTRASSTAGPYLVGTSANQWGFASNGYTVECFFTTTATGSNQIPVSVAKAIGPAADGSLYAFSDLPVGQVSSAGLVGTTSVIDGRLHHLAATIDNAGNTVFYLDGVSYSSGPSTPVGALQMVLIGRGINGNFFSGTISHVAIYPKVLSGARIAAHAASGLSGATGELSGARWNRLCNIGGLGSSTYTADTGLTTMGVQETLGKSLAAALQEVVDAEQGTAYCTAAGVFTLKGRAARYNASSSLTIVPTTLSRDLLFSANDAYLVNDAEVTRVGGATGRAVNTASQTDYDVVSKQLSVYVDTDVQALTLAQWLVANQGTPTARTRQFTIDATAKAATITAAQVLALDVGTLVTLSPLPVSAPASSVDVFIEGLSGSIGDQWSVTYNTSPKAASNVWALDNATWGVLDSTTRLAF